MPAYNWRGQSGRTKDWPLRMAGAVTFYDAEFSASLEAVGCHKLVKCYGNLQDKFQLTTFPLMITNTH